MTAITGDYARLTSDAKARVAFMRFGLGPKPGGRARIGSGADDAYLACLAELDREAAKIDDNLVRVTSAVSSNPLGSKDPVPPRAFAATLENCGTVAANPLSGNVNLEILQAESTARYVKQLEPEVGFLERLVLFWNNHFSVFNGKARAMVGHMERSAIRCNVLGNFGDMLEAVAKHPAMITYLDNNTSCGPNSDRAKKNPRSYLTYNENLAREILELHTLGVNGGYTQQDVTEFAKVLTGWHIVRKGQTGENGQGDGQFTFAADAHEPGPLTVLGRSFDQGSGPQQGLDVLRYLATHPRTAEHIAYKLIHHFITDTPSAEDVATLSGVFLSSNGNLLAVSKALLALPSAWTEPFSRLRQPYLWLVSMTRGLDMNAADVTANRWRYDVFCGFMGQQLWCRITPDGYPDDNYFWMTPDAVRLRSDLAMSTSKVRWPGLRPPDLARDLLGTNLASDTEKEIAAWDRDDRIGLTFIFLTPDYMRR